MDILQISYFSKVYETTNYAHAAESLCVSRQGLRKVMRNLEREVGQPLFVNVANRLQPTEAAHRLYKASRTFVEGFRELEDAVAAMKLSQKTEVRLGGTYDSDDVFTTAEWRAFRSYPTEEHDINVKLRYVRGSRPTLLAALLDGSLDYAHVVFTELDETRFECRIAREGRIFLTMRSDHPLGGSRRSDHRGSAWCAALHALRGQRRGRSHAARGPGSRGGAGRGAQRQRAALAPGRRRGRTGGHAHLPAAR